MQSCRTNHSLVESDSQSLSETSSCSSFITANAQEEYGLLPSPLLREGETLIFTFPYPLTWYCPDHIRAEIESLYEMILQLSSSEIHENVKPDDLVPDGGFGIEIASGSVGHAINISMTSDQKYYVSWWTHDTKTNTQVLTSHFTFQDEACHQKIEKILRLAEEYWQSLA